MLWWLLRWAAGPSLQLTSFEPRSHVSPLVLSPAQVPGRAPVHTPASHTHWLLLHLTGRLSGFLVSNHSLLLLHPVSQPSLEQLHILGPSPQMSGTFSFPSPGNLVLLNHPVSSRPKVMVSDQRTECWCPDNRNVIYSSRANLSVGQRRTGVRKDSEKLGTFLASGTGQLRQTVHSWTDYLGNSQPEGHLPGDNIQASIVFPLQAQKSQKTRWATPGRAAMTNDPPEGAHLENENG